MSIISLGPFITATGKTGIVVDGFVDTGFCIEFSGEDFGLSLPLFRQVQQWRPRTATFDNYYIGGEHLSFNVQSDPYHCVATEYGKFIRLGCVLSSLYRFNDVRRPLLKVLEEFAGCLPVKADRLHRRISGGAEMLAEGLQQSGFEVIGSTSYGRSLHVQIGWVLNRDRGADRKTGGCFYAICIHFQPQPDRSLNHGRWQLPAETSLGFMLGQMVVARTGSQPLNALSPTGRKAVLKRFKWTKVSMLNAKQLKAARLSFIVEHPELLQDSKAMAKSMQQNGLYTDITELAVIYKQVPKLIVEARNEQSGK